MPRQINALTVSRDTLNPLLNTEILKKRLADIEYYNTLHGAKYANWPYFFMKNAGNYMWRYKYNLAVKGFAAYMVYREVQQYRNLSEKTLMTIQQSGNGMLKIGANSAIFGTMCFLL